MKLDEFGRSMVEMLGVLAIMGVLTVASLGTYRVAMNKFQSNAIAETVALLSIYAQSRNVNIENLDDFKKEWGDYIPDCIVTASAMKNGQVNVTFENTSHCQEIMQLVENTFGSKRWKTKSKTEASFAPGGRFE